MIDRLDQQFEDHDEVVGMMRAWDNFDSGQSSCVFGRDNKYRYALRRQLAPLMPVAADASCLFIMLNPSTADEIDNDPTVTRCERFAARWGYSTLYVANLFAYRATDPQALYSICTKDGSDPVGPHNDDAIMKLAKRASRIVCAWGNHGALRGRGRKVEQALRDNKICIRALGMTKQGFPPHPLYLPNHRKASIWKKGKWPDPQPK